MLAAVIVLAVLVGLLAVLLVVERRRRTRQQDEAAERAASIQTAVEDAESRAAAAHTEVAAAQGRAAAAEREHQAELVATAEVAEERGRAHEQLTQTAAERDLVAGERDELVAVLDEATRDVGSLNALVVELEAEVGRLVEDHRPGIESATLWALELFRSERTWRHSVATAPDAASPFIEAEDPLGLAVEVEVAALREDVGVAMDLSWQARVDDPARCLLVLRIAQELLAAAAREHEDVTLDGRAGPDGEVVLHLRVSEGGALAELAPACLSDHLVTVSTDDGLRLTIH